MALAHLQAGSPVGTSQENIRRNFGMPQPNGYRKALRFMRHANKFGLPIITIVDTPGAYAGKSAEELGQVSPQGGEVASALPMQGGSRTCCPDEGAESPELPMAPL